MKIVDMGCCSEARRDDVHEVRAGPDVQAGGAALHLGHHYVLGPADAAGLRQQGGQAHEHLPQPPQASLSSQKLLRAGCDLYWRLRG